MLLPDRYDGASSWADYLMHFESVASVNRWNELERVGYLASHLRGLAQEAFADLSPEARKDYESVLGPNFPSGCVGRGESLEELGRSIQRLVL